MGVRAILRLLTLSVLSLSGATASRTPHTTSPVPQVDHHQHLLSSSLAAALTNAPPVAGTLAPVTADLLIRQLDAAGIRRALVLSLAYLHGSPGIRGNDELAQVQRENDWTSEQVGRFPDRLRAFCSFNPLRDYALKELERCTNMRSLRHGLKLHFANSQVDLRNPKHVEQVRAVFGAANARGMPIVVHLWTERGYGKEAAQIFLDRVIPTARDIPIQIAHLSGAGPGLDASAKEALVAFADAVSAGDPRTQNLYFDVATIVTSRTSAEDAAFIAARLRQLGLLRILYGSDAAIRGNPEAKESWNLFTGKLPLTETEFKTIAENVAPYMR